MILFMRLLEVEEMKNKEKYAKEEDDEPWLIEDLKKLEVVEEYE